MFKKREEDGIREENIILPSQRKEKILTKKLPVFYNPVMKLNRDLTILVIASYFEKRISFCDPMCASGIRELRLLSTIEESFKELICGDISKKALEEFKKNLSKNKISKKNIKFLEGHAINTLSQGYYNYIEIDPFGSPVPFLDTALQRIKHEGILAVTATDTAALCGTYPKTTLRKYGIKVEKTLFYEELGLRNLIAYCMREAAKYEKNLIPLLSYSKDHYYRIFFQVEESRTNAYKKALEELKYIVWNKESQEIQVENFERKESLGKTYIGKLNNKVFLKNLCENLFLLKEQKEAEQLLHKLLNELDMIGYINPHKLAKSFKFDFTVSFEKLCDTLLEEGYKVSRVHNNPLGIKTNAPYDEIVTLAKKLGKEKINTKEK